MIRKALTTSLLIFALAVSPFASLADEGMWLPDALDKLPLSQLKKRGFELKPEDVYSTTKASLKDAIVQISIGGTGSFVSPDGLILTNHHVGFSAITRASTPEKDYINNGFLAKSRPEEIPAQGYTISILQEFKDVTAEVNSAAGCGSFSEMKCSIRGQCGLIASTVAPKSVSNSSVRAPEWFNTVINSACDSRTLIGITMPPAMITP